MQIACVFLQRRILPIAIAAALAQGVQAQAPSSGGSQMQQISPPPRATVAPAAGIRVDEGSGLAAPSDSGAKINVSNLRIAGSSVFTEAELLAITAFQPGSSLTLDELRAIAAKITGHYHANGYFVAQATVPAQDIKNGVVTINVVEGKIGKISVTNQSNASDRLVSSLVDGLKASDVVSIAPLERRLLLLSDLPGVNVRSSLAPGASVGASDLVIDVTPGERVSGSIEADNHGNRYTGANRIGASVNFNQLAGQGDVASLRALTSAAGLNYVRAAYQGQIASVKAGVAYTALQYQLGREFSALEARGTAQIGSVYASYPLIRSRNSSLYVQLAYDSKTFQDKVDSTATVTDKKARVLMASVTGDRRDARWGGALLSYSLTFTAGSVDIQTPAARATDDATVRSNGQFGKLSYSIAHGQNITDTTMLHAAISGQYASKNLDVSEKLGVGGASGVRAYPSGEAFGDAGYVLNLELRSTLPKLVDGQAGVLQLVGFVDTGTVTLVQNPVVAGNNRRTLSGAGVGLNWSDGNNFALKAYIARKLGNAAATSAPDSRTRLWLQGVKYF